MPATGENDIHVLDEPATYSDAVASSSDEEITNTKAIDIKSDIKTVCASKKLATFESLPSKKNHEEFIKTCKLFDFKVKDTPSTHDDLIKVLKETIQYSVKTGHPYFVNQLFSSLDPYGLVGQWLTDALNPSVYTYEVSPVFTLMEETVLKEMRKIVGFKDGLGDGIFCPGGSMSNGYAINCARHKFIPDFKTKGLHSLPRLVLFTSEDAHYSVKKMASFLGIGSDNVYLIKTNSRGRMDVGHLIKEVERSLSEGGAPFMVSATAGTTVIGAFDPLEEIANVCEKYSLWLHVDAAWGGGALVSKKTQRIACRNRKVGFSEKFCQ
ncbi:hypothetical protein NQ314_006555 [Rhamnusium bicolor]|uniref:Glutamate decarboxylase n=1 Tax=Rhamnusium bicolor TaxID=1586634 RepID=A0AAV8Z0L9_9CUCU|nr:hypothetical protein NQ314_006555 [Rhamnusium bicolor]